MTGLTPRGLQEAGRAGLEVCAAVSRRASQLQGVKAGGRGQLAWFRVFSQWIKHQAGGFRVQPVLWMQLPAERRECRVSPAEKGGRSGVPLSNPAGTGCRQRGWWRREAPGRDEESCSAQPSLPPSRLLLAGPQPRDLKECLSRPVGGARADEIAAKSLGRAGHCPAHWLGHTVDSKCHSSLPLNHCVCALLGHTLQKGSGQ